MTSLPFISIIIPAKNEERLIRNCIHSIHQLAYPRERHEIIIADGLSTDNTANVASEMGAKVIPNPKQTVSPGRNVGFAHAKGDLIAFTDADCLVDENWLSNSVKYFEQDDMVACVGGPNKTPADESNFGKGVGFVFDQPVFAAGSIHARDLKELEEVTSIPGCNAIYRHDVLAKVMPLDETMLTCDDTKLNREILDLGYKLLYTPDVMVVHYRRPTPLKLWKQFYRYAIGRLQVGKADPRMINPMHIFSGLSIPFFSILLLVLYNCHLTSFFGVLLSGILFLLFFSVKGMLKWKSFMVGMHIPLIILLIMTAWSCGFMRELVFPMHTVKGK